MSWCKICGSDKYVKFRTTHFWSMCQICWEESDPPITRTEFDRKFWHPKDDAPEPTKREFYEDYKTSGLAFEKYKEQTTVDMG